MLYIVCFSDKKVNNILLKQLKILLPKEKSKPTTGIYLKH